MNGRLSWGSFVLLSCCISIVAAPSATAEDLILRQEAIRLMERANAVSTPIKLPDLERVDSFRVFGADGSAKDGEIRRLAIQGVGRRDDIRFGDFQQTDVWKEGHLETNLVKRIQPSEVEDVERATPMFRVRFDDTDVIRSITSREAVGHAARCISFDTITGQKTVTGEFCVDAKSGVLLSARIDNYMLENRDFFSFSGELLPGKISVFFAGSQHIEITQSIRELTDIPADGLTAPPNAIIWSYCKISTRPFVQNAPQPKPGNGGVNTDLRLKALIGPDGAVREPVVQSLERPDLHAEALALVSTWKFIPSTCDGRNVGVTTELTVHFQGR